ncbi:MAG: hypothetical protein JNL92_15930 [Opitutaceae bacterium]|nr:hypothetical protein [Opitutaceae bacterium]
MTPSPDHDDKLEQFVQRAVRDLPPRRAPRSLEARVRAEIERRAGRPWWARSFAHWPAAARAGFVLLSLAFVGLFVVSGMWITPGLGGWLPAAAGWIESGLTVLRALGSCLDIVERNIPPLWRYGGLAVVAALYFTLFGLGAAAYRVLQNQR